MTYTEDFYNAAEQLISAGRFIDSKAWVPATSGNFSIRLGDGTIAITVSGKHKGRLQTEDIMLIDASGQALDGKTPSAETLLHTSIYQCFPEIQSVLHPHTLNSVLISKRFQNQCVLENYELLKAFPGFKTHDSRLIVPIFANDQDIPRLAKRVENYFTDAGVCYAYIIAGHGLYAWGHSVADALRHLEALDFLFACELQLQGVNLS